MPKPSELPGITDSDKPQIAVDAALAEFTAAPPTHIQALAPETDVVGRVNATIDALRSPENGTPNQDWTLQALEFLGAVRQIDEHIATLQDLENQPKLGLGDYGAYSRVSRALDTMFSGVAVVFDDPQEKEHNPAGNSVSRGLTEICCRITGRIAKPAASVIHEAYRHQQIADEELFRTAGDVLHEATRLAEQVATHFTSPEEVRVSAQKQALDLQPNLLECDALGYHGELSEAAAHNIMQHVRHLISAKPFSESRNRDRLLPSLAAFATDRSKRAGKTPQDIPLLITAIEANEFLYDALNRNYRMENARIQASRRLIRQYRFLAQIRGKQEFHQEACGHLRSALDLGLEFDIPLPKEFFMEYVSALRALWKGQPDGDRLAVWSLHIRRLLPDPFIFNSQEKSQAAVNIAAEINLWESRLLEDRFLGNRTLKTLAAAIILVAEEPCKQTIDNLKHSLDAVDKEKYAEYSAKTRQRLILLGELLQLFWQDDMMSNPSEVLKPYQQNPAIHAFAALDAITRTVVERGIASPEGAAVSPWCAAQIMVHHPHLETLRPAGLDFSALFGGQMPNGIAAPMVVRQSWRKTAASAQILLQQDTARRFHIPPEISLDDLIFTLRNLYIPAASAVDVIDAIAVVPAIDAPPQAGEVGFGLKITAQPALTVVFADGNLVGFFITSPPKPHILISAQTEESGATNLWKALLTDRMSYAEAVRRGDLPGSIQAISIPIVIQNEDGGGEFSLPVPPPSDGIALPAVSTVADLDRMKPTDIIWQMIFNALKIKTAKSAQTTGLVNYQEVFNFLFNQSSRLGGVRSLSSDSNAFLISAPVSKPTHIQLPRRGYRLHEMAIGESQIPGEKHTEFTKPFSFDPTRSVILFQIKLIAVTQGNTVKVIEELSAGAS